MPDLMGLDDPWPLDSLAIQALHEAPNLATVALLAAVLPQYLDARHQAMFQQAMRRR